MDIKNVSYGKYTIVYWPKAIHLWYQGRHIGYFPEMDEEKVKAYADGYTKALQNEFDFQEKALILRTQLSSIINR